MKKIIVVVAVFCWAAACSVEGGSQEVLNDPGTPAAIAGLPASYDGAVSVKFELPSSVHCGALVGASVDVDPQEQGAQIVVSPVDEAQGRPLRWVRVVSGEYDTWYGVGRRGDAVGATAIKLWPGANQITAVASSTDGFDVGQSNYCFVTLAQ